MLKRGRSGQVAIEYLMVIGSTLFVISILMIVYAEQTQEQGSELTSSQINLIGNKLIDTAEEVYYRGSPARKTLKVYIPTNVHNLTIYPNSIVFTIKIGSGYSDIDFLSTVPLQGDFLISQGVKNIAVIAEDSYVCIVEEGQPECP